jgi:hypothetical protein
VAEQAVVGVRNAANGKAARLGSLEARTPSGDVAKRETANPMEGAVGSDTSGGYETEEL